MKKDRMTLYTVDYTGIGYNASYRKIFTNYTDALAFSRRDFADKPICRTYTRDNAIAVIALAEENGDFAG